MSSSSDYPALVTYLRYQVKRSYRGFLKLNCNAIITSLSSNLDTEELDNLWSCHFLCKAKEILTQENWEESFVKLKEKVEFERSCKWLKPYWDSVIKDYRRKSIKSWINDSDHGNSLDKYSFDHNNNNHYNDSDDIPAPEIANLLQEDRLNDDGQKAHPVIPLSSKHEELIGPAEQAEMNQIIMLDQSNSNSSNPQTQSRRCSSSPLG
ncbi:4887_t:CDS:2 [Funneliformis geosporum]|uniref:4887_t:CDS:1 n=1 Tax=Funneliformis geosporum TaxID=1117311 RepID=A0A9W4SUS7_9GLOM|nr:4887_t:CDS:2 [Funneliformis geosporum]